MAQLEIWSFKDHPKEQCGLQAARVKLIVQSSKERAEDRFSVDDALRFLCENDLTKQQYQNVRNMTMKIGYDIFPTYTEGRDNKSTCYPRDKILNCVKVFIFFLLDSLLLLCFRYIYSTALCRSSATESYRSYGWTYVYSSWWMYWTVHATARKLFNCFQVGMW